MSFVGRNDPCPCGSGKKFKKCCVDKRDPLDVALRFHDLDGTVVAASLRHACSADLTWDPTDVLDGGYEDDYPRAQIHGPLAAYVLEVADGLTAADLLVRDRARSLDDRALRWIEAQKESWLSVWEVTSVDRGRTMDVVDRLTGEKRRVYERGASESVPVRALILARVVDFEGLSVFVGTHPAPLPPRLGAAFLDAMKQELGPLDVEALRGEGMALELLDAWEDALMLRDAQASQQPVLHNTDGEPFVMTTQRFELTGAAPMPAVLAAIASLEGAARHEDEIVLSKEGNAMHASWDNTTLGTLRRQGDGLVLETNSVERSDRLCARIEAALPGALVRGDREALDANALRERARREPPPEPEPLGEEERAVLQEMLSRHYEEWPNQSLPALGGKTPRQAVRTKKGRAMVDELLKELEFMESQKPVDQQFAVATLRAELGLESA